MCLFTIALSYRDTVIQFSLETLTRVTQQESKAVLTSVIMRRHCCANITGNFIPFQTTGDLQSALSDTIDCHPFSTFEEAFENLGVWCLRFFRNICCLLCGRSVDSQCKNRGRLYCSIASLLTAILINGLMLTFLRYWPRLNVFNMVACICISRNVTVWIAFSYFPD